MSRSLYENHWGSPTLTLLNVLGVLGVLNVLNVLNVLYVLNVLHGRIVGLLGLVFSNNSRTDGRMDLHTEALTDLPSDRDAV